MPTTLTPDSESLDVDVEAADDEFHGIFSCSKCGGAFKRERWLGDKPYWNKCNRCYNDEYVEAMCRPRRVGGNDIDEWGWAPIIRELHRKLTELNPDYRIAQVKEKFGGLRYYIDGHTEEMYALIREAENASYKTCEVCGRPGKLRGGGWILTLCDDDAGDREPLDDDDDDEFPPSMGAQLNA